jgi:hypothetical protein
VTWIILDSDAFAATAYDQTKQQLYLRFRSGKIYRYFDFPLNQFDEFLAADSRGRYFSEQIRDKFAYEEVRTRSAGR